MDIHELTNGEVEFKDGSQSYKIKRLSLYELSYDIEKQVKEEYYSNIQKKASMLNGEDKIKYLQGVKELGDEEIIKLCVDKSQTFRGRCEELFKILNKCQKAPMEDVEALIMDEKSWPLIAAIQNYALSGKLAEQAKEAAVEDKKK